MADDITANYKNAMNNALSVANSTYNTTKELAKGNRYFVIDKRNNSKSGTVITMHANTVNPLGTKTVYDFSITGPAAQITYNDKGEIVDASMVPSLTIGAVLSSGTTSPDDDFTVLQSTNDEFTKALDNIRNWILGLVK